MSKTKPTTMPIKKIIARLTRDQKVRKKRAKKKESNITHLLGDNIIKHNMLICTPFIYS